jgi:hypothetical protein
VSHVITESLIAGTRAMASPAAASDGSRPCECVDTRIELRTIPMIGRPVPVTGVSREICVKIATTQSEWEDAFRLVALTYRSRGYEPEDTRDLRFTPFHALPDTVTFVAKHGNEVVATLSLVLDNVLLGLPMEGLYGPEVAGLRGAGRRLVEVTSLADQSLSLREFTPVFLALMRLMSQYGIRQNADTWAITINPRHRLFYTRVMGFVPLGEQRAYPSVQNHPAEAYMLDFEQLKTHNPDMLQKIFGEWLGHESLTACPMPCSLVRAFSARSRHADQETIQRIFQHVAERGTARRWCVPPTLRQ